MFNYFILQKHNNRYNNICATFIINIFKIMNSYLITITRHNIYDSILNKTSFMTQTKK